MQINTGILGEFRIVKRNQNTNEIIMDTGFQKNILLNQGVEFFGGNNGYDMMSYCVIGTGNSTPTYTQVKLDNCIVGISGRYSSIKVDYDAADGNLYKANRVRKYSVTGLSNVNITEIGLASAYTNSTNYNLCTRALIKDVAGTPTTITILSGEILDIYYKLWQVHDLTDKTGQINVIDGNGNKELYNYTLRMAGVGGANIGGSANYGEIVGTRFDMWSGNNLPGTFSGNIGTMFSMPGNAISYVAGSGSYTDAYVRDSKKAKCTYGYDIGQMNGNIRSFAFMTSMGFYQIQFDRVSDGAPIVKTNTQTLSLPFEFTWDRYEGAL